MQFVFSRQAPPDNLTKESAPDELVKAIRQISQGKKYISPSLAEKLAIDLEVSPDKLPHEILSDREYQVMCMIASGKTLKEIADGLSLSIKTISTYRSRILEKMNMKTVYEMRYRVTLTPTADPKEGVSTMRLEPSNIEGDWDITGPGGCVFR